MKAWPAPELPGVPVVPGRPRLYDTGSRAVVDVGPEVGPARMYVCGITPYDATHLGHANTYVAFDLLNRVWRDCGFHVAYTQNVTDVDDPLLERATDTGVEWTDLAEQQVELFRTDMTALRVLPPDDYVGAVEAIPQVIALIELLQHNGAVYPADDAEYPDLYFDVASDPDFGFLSGLDEAEACAVCAERGGDPDRPGSGTRWTAWCGGWNGRANRPGTPRSGVGVRGGTSSAARSC